MPAPTPAARAQGRVARSPARRPRRRVALESALASVSADEIRSDIFFIASDELGGRETPSPGLQIAGLLPARALAAHGLEPGAQDGYFYTYPLGSERSTSQPAARGRGRRPAARLVLGAD
jgi:hypothetical protein